MFNFAVKLLSDGTSTNLISSGFCFKEFDFVRFLLLITVLRKGHSKGRNWEKVEKYTYNMIKIV